MAIALVGLAVWASLGTSSAPSAAQPGDPDAGRILFEVNCARCHGVAAEGTDSGPPLVHPLYVPSHHADAAFLRAVRGGVQPHHWTFGRMPSIDGLSDGEVTDIVARVRDLQRRAGLIGEGD